MGWKNGALDIPYPDGHNADTRARRVALRSEDTVEDRPLFGLEADCFIEARSLRGRLGVKQPRKKLVEVR